MLIDFSTQAAHWAPSAPVGVATIVVAPRGTTDPEADLVVDGYGAAAARGGSHEASEHSEGLLELTLPFRDGTIRRAFVVTSPTVADGDPTRSAQDALVERVQLLHADSPEALIVLVHAFARTLRDGHSPSRRTFERRMVEAGVDVLVSTRAESQPHIDVVEGRPAIEGQDLTVTIDLLPDRTTAGVEYTNAPDDHLDAYTDLLTHTHDAVAFLRAVTPEPDQRRGRVTIEMDERHSAPAYAERYGTARTHWEDRPETLPFDRSIPARTYMWERELRCRGAAVDVIGTDVLSGVRPDGEPFLVHSTATDLTGVPGTIAAADDRIARRLLGRAGIAVAGTSTTADPTEQVRLTVVEGVSRAAIRRVAPTLIGDEHRNVRDLVNDTNDARWSDVHLHSALIALTPERLIRLRDAGMDLYSILPDGEAHTLDRMPDDTRGTDPVDVTESIHVSYHRIAEKAAAAFPGLRAAGVDIRSSDLSRAADRASYAVSSVTALPDTASHGAPVIGHPRNVVATAVDSLVAVPEPPKNVHRRRRPEKVGAPTSARMLAAEFSARGFDVDWLSEDLFFAAGHGRTIGVHGAMTDRTSHAARMVLSRPLLRRRVLTASALPQPPARTFGHAARERAWRHARSFDAATVQFGEDGPLDMHGMTKEEFDESWKQKLRTIREHRCSVARRLPGERIRFLVVHGRVLGVLRERGPQAGTIGRHPHRSYGRLAADAARSFAGADITQVTLVVARPDVPATADSVVVEDVRLDPDLTSFMRGGAKDRGIIGAIVDLHLGAARPRGEPPGVWAEDATNMPALLRSAAGRASRMIVRRARQRLDPASAVAQREHEGLLFEIREGSARLVGATEQFTDLVVPGTIDGVLVTAVAAESFRDVPGLRTVELPPGVRTIGDQAFRACSDLHTVVLPTDLQSIGDHAFSGCGMLTTLQYFVATGPKKERIVRRNMVETSLPLGVTNIGIGAFADCVSLEHMALPYRTTRVRESILAGCTSLQSVWLHNEIEQIDARAFVGTALAAIRIPDSLTSFPADAFEARTAIVCAAGSDAHVRACEISLAVAPYRAASLSVDSAWGAEEGDTVRDVLESTQKTEELTTLYELRPAVETVDRRDEDRSQPLRPARFRREDGVYRSTAASVAPCDTTITMVGDLMCGSSQQRSALRDGEYDFTESFEYVREFFLDADLVLGNLETMVSPSHPLSSDSLYVDARPHLNAPFAYLAALRNAGFDAVLNAQNHMYDTCTRGILETLDALNDAQLVHGGLYASADEDRFLLFSIHDMTIGVVAYLDPNRQRMKKAHFTTEGLGAMASLFHSPRVSADIDAAKAAGAEFVLAYCHWGEEYTSTISQRQSQYAQMVADAGADYVFGSHSHCPQHYTVLTTPDGRRVPVVYSGGNFVSHITRHKPITQDSFIASLTLTRDENGRVIVKRDGYLPCRIVPHRTIRGRVSVVPVDDLEQGELGYSPATAQTDRERIASALGPQYRSRPRTAFP